MRFVKPIINGVLDFATSKTVQSAVTSTIKGTDSTIAKAAVEVVDFTPDFIKGLSEIPQFSTFSQETQDIIVAAKKRIWEVAKTRKDSKSIYEKNVSYIDTLIKYGSEEKYISKVLENNKNFLNYQLNRTITGKEFKAAKYTNVEDWHKFVTNISLMRMFNKQGTASLAKNAFGMKEIAAGRLNLSYLKTLEPSNVLCDDFFYKLFDNVEKSAFKKLSAKGLDEQTIKKILKHYDKDILENPKNFESFIKTIEDIENPEVLQKMIAKFEDHDIFEYQHEFFLKLCAAAKENPELLEKALKIEKTNPYITNRIINTMKDPEAYKVSDEMFEEFLNWQTKYPDNIELTTFVELNKALGVAGVDDAFVKNLFNYCRQNNINFDNIVRGLNDNSVDFLKQMLKDNDFGELNLYKFSEIAGSSEYKDPRNWGYFDIEYEEVFLPMKKAFINNGKPEEQAYYMAKDLTRFFRNLDPKTAKIFEEYGFRNLIMEGKIDARILNDITENSQFTPAFLADLELLKAGKTTAIKHFDSVKDVLRQTSAGDVVSVNGKMYINNNGQLEPWNMSEETFDKLFPLGDRFSGKQNYGNCYLISTLKNLYENPRTRGTYYKMFEEINGDIHLTIPAYKDYNGTIVFKNGEIFTDWDCADAAKHLQMVEQTYEKTALRTGSQIDAAGAESFEDLKYLHTRATGGTGEDVLNEILADLKAEGKVSIQTIKGKENIENALSIIENNPRYIVYESHKTSPTRNHAWAVKSYNPTTRTVQYSDPNQTVLLNTISLEDLLKNNNRIVVARYA